MRRDERTGAHGALPPAPVVRQPRGRPVRPSEAAVRVCALGKYERGRDDLEEREWGHLPEWCAGAPFKLFASADQYERSNARLYIELECALPAELDLDQCIALARALADAVAASGLPYVWAIHAGRPVAPGEPRRRHLHLTLS